VFILCHYNSELQEIQNASKESGTKAYTARLQAPVQYLGRLLGRPTGAEHQNEAFSDSPPLGNYDAFTLTYLCITLIVDF
jgi:hypothetical protein